MELGYGFANVGDTIGCCIQARGIDVAIGLKYRCKI